MTMYSFSVGYRGLSTWRKGERRLLVGVAAPRIRRAAGKASAIASSFFRSGWWGRKTPAEADLRLTNQRRLPTTPPVGALVVPNVSRHPTLGWWERYSTSTCRVVILFNARITSDNPSDVTLVSDEFSRFCLVLFVYALFGASVRLSTIVDVFFVVFYIFGKYPRTHLITFYLLFVLGRYLLALFPRNFPTSTRFSKISPPPCTSSIRKFRPGHVLLCKTMWPANHKTYY
jgi:hypothetical protein